MADNGSYERFESPVWLNEEIKALGIIHGWFGGPMVVLHSNWITNIGEYKISALCRTSSAMKQWRIANVGYFCVLKEREYEELLSTPKPFEELQMELKRKLNYEEGI